MPHISKIIHHEEKHGDMSFHRDICKITLDPLEIIPWENSFLPKFEIGQTVFVAHKDNGTAKYDVHERFIHSIECRIVAWKNKAELITTGYTLDQPIGHDFDVYVITPGNIFSTRQQAEDVIRWIPIDLPYEVFKTALGCAVFGDRDDDLIENCELQTCCANISYIRDTLIRAMLNRGLIAREADVVQSYLNEHEKPEKYDNLKRITDALGMKIDWLNKADR